MQLTVKESLLDITDATEYAEKLRELEIAKRKEREQQRQDLLAAFAEKKVTEGLTVEDVDAKLDVIIKMLQDLMPK